MSISVRPQVGQTTSSGVDRSRRPSATRICAAIRVSITGSPAALTPDRVADSLGQKRAEGDGRRDRRILRQARVGQPEVQRVLEALGETAG